MKFLNKVKLFVILVSLFLIENVSAELYRLAARRPNSIGDFFESLFTTELKFGMVNDVELWLFLLVGLAVFTVLFLGFSRIHMFEENRNAAAILAGIMTLITLLASPLSTWISVLGLPGLILLVLIVLFAGLKILFKILGFGFGGVSGWKLRPWKWPIKLLKGAGKLTGGTIILTLRILWKLLKLFVRLLDSINKLCRMIDSLPDPDEEDYEREKNRIVAEINGIKGSLQKIRRFARRMIYYRLGLPRWYKRLNKELRKLEKTLDRMIRLLNNGKPKKAQKLCKILRGRIKILMIAIKRARRDLKVAKRKPSGGGEEEEVPGEDDVPDDGGSGAGKGEEELGPDDEEGPEEEEEPEKKKKEEESIEQLKEEYLEIVDEANKLPEGSEERVALEKEGLKIYEKLKDRGVEFK